MAHLLDRRLRQLQRRRSLAILVWRLVPWWGLALITAAVAVLALRSAHETPLVWQLGLVAVALAVPVLLALVVLRRHRESPAQLAGHLDRLCGAEGLVMALAAQPAAERDADWLARLRRPLEELRWPRWTPAGGRLFGLGLLCLAVAALVPVSRDGGTRTVPWEEFFRPSHERLATVAGAGLLPAEELSDLQRRVERLRELAQGHGMDPGIWQGLDRVDRDLADGVARSARRLSEVLNSADRVARAPQGQEVEARLGALARGVANLGRRMPSALPLADAGSDLGRQLRRLLREQGERGELSPSQLALLRELGGEAVRPGRNEPLDPLQADELAQRLAEHLRELQERLAEAGCPGCEGGPGGEQGEDPGGRGGVDRGPGHAPLAFSHQTREGAGEGSELPAGARLNADGSITVAEERRAAELDDAALRSLQRARDRAFDPSSADARRSAVAPRHRAAVGAYFGSDHNGGDATEHPIP